MNKPAVGSQDVSVRDHVGEVAAISKHTDEEVMLTSFSAGQQTGTSFAKSSESNPVPPRQFRPRSLAFIPMQDDRVVGSSFHRLSRPDVMTAISGLPELRGPAHGDDPSSRAHRCDQLADLEVFCRLLATVADDFILNGLPFIERTQAGPLDRRNMNKHILAATLGLNESIALGRIEPLHGACGHRRLLAFYAVWLCACRATQTIPSFG